MNQLSDDTMWDLLFDVLSDYEKGTPSTSKLVKVSCDYLTNNSNDGMSTEDICDSVLGFFDYYNNYIDERNVEMHKITQNEYDMTVLMLNSAINLILEERQ